MPAAYWDESPDDLEDREYPDIEDDEGITITCPNVAPNCLTTRINAHPAAGT